MAQLTIVDHYGWATKNKDFLLKVFEHCVVDFIQNSMYRSYSTPRNEFLVRAQL